MRFAANRANSSREELESDKEEMEEGGESGEGNDGEAEVVREVTSGWQLSIEKDERLQEETKVGATL